MFCSSLITGDLKNRGLEKSTVLLFWGCCIKIDRISSHPRKSLDFEPLGLCFDENRIFSLFLLLNTQTASEESKGYLCRRAYSHLCGMYIFMISVYFSSTHNSFAFNIPCWIDFLQTTVNTYSMTSCLEFATLNDILKYSFGPWTIF